MSPCEQCPPCRFTDYVPGDGSQQASIQHCKVSPGCGTDIATPPSDNSTNVPSANECPVGFYGPGDAAGANTTANPGCVKCPAGQSTSAAGSAACDGELTLECGCIVQYVSSCLFHLEPATYASSRACLNLTAAACCSACPAAAAAVCAAGSGIQDGSDSVASCSACACGSYSTGQSKACSPCPTTAL
jgi:hypothetical protein